MKKKLAYFVIAVLVSMLGGAAVADPPGGSCSPPYGYVLSCKAECHGNSDCVFNPDLSLDQYCLKVTNTEYCVHDGYGDECCTTYYTCEGPNGRPMPCGLF